MENNFPEKMGDCGRHLKLFPIYVVEKYTLILPSDVFYISRLIFGMLTELCRSALKLIRNILNQFLANIVASIQRMYKRFI